MLLHFFSVCHLTSYQGSINGSLLQGFCAVHMNAGSAMYTQPANLHEIRKNLFWPVLPRKEVCLMPLECSMCMCARLSWCDAAGLLPLSVHATAVLQLGMCQGTYNSRANAFWGLAAVGARLKHQLFYLIVHA